MRIAQTLSALGYLLLVVVGLPTLADRSVPHDARFWAWAVVYAVFAVAYHVGAQAAITARRRRIGSLAVMTPAMLGLAALQPCHFGAMSLVIAASQVALLFSARETIAWIAVQSGAIAFFLGCDDEVRESVAHMIALLGFQGFAAAAVYTARRESELADRLANTNAELLATRALLAENSRAHERARIARELHDVLGHDLTALSLQLEVASHVPAVDAACHVRKARDVSTRLLTNVREVVTATRASEGVDLRAALTTLAESAPALDVAIDMPESVHIDDDARAHCVLRCVQEIITNALRHAHAKRLVVRIRQEDGELSIVARDDGRGAALVRDGSGISGMRARLAELGGELSIDTEPEKSFIVSARLPLTAEGA